MKDKYSLSSALWYGQKGKIEEWIHDFLNNEGDNKAFSVGLKLFPRYYIGPILMPLYLFRRCCGPEEDMKYVIEKSAFINRVTSIKNRFDKGWDMPPLIINYTENGFELSDGNHRFQALINSNIAMYYVIIWITKESDYKEFIIKYAQYLK